MPRYDLAILGGGSGGYVAAIRGCQLGLKTCLVEKGLVGGTCLNRGCIPVKALLHAADLLERARNSERFGVMVKEAEFSFSKAMDRKAEVVKRLREGVEQLLKNRKADVIRGRGRLVARNTMEVDTGKGSLTIKSGKTIIATGSEPLELPSICIDGERFLSSTEALVLRELPETLVIIGGGYIGCEFASMFSAFGVEVTILEMTDQLLPGIYPLAARTLQRQMERKGIKIVLKSKVSKVFRERKKATCELASGERVSGEKVLVAVGRKLNSHGIGLEEIGVETKDGGIVVDEHMETSLAGTYAVGDVVNRGLLAHVAHHQGMVAAENAAGGASKMDYSAIPWVVFTSPEVAVVGLTPEDAKKEGREVVVGKFPFAAVGKAVISGETDGFAQVVADAGTGEILGGQIVGPDASNLISEVVSLMNAEGTLEELSRGVHPHPTLSEAAMEAAFDAKGEAIHIFSGRSRQGKESRGRRRGDEPGRESRGDEVHEGA